MGMVNFLPLLVLGRSAMALVFITSALISPAAIPQTTPKSQSALPAAAPIQLMDPQPLPEVEKPEMEAAEAAVAAASPARRSTFTQDVSLGDGQRQLTLSTAPLHYQDEAGAWQEIDPRFTREEGGFTNFTNALNISSGESIAIINLSRGDMQVQWQPLKLERISAGEAQATLAEVLDPSQAAPGELVDGSQTVRYPASWSLPEIAEEVSAAPGMAEQKLVLQSRLAQLSGCTGESLMDVSQTPCNLLPDDRLALHAVLRLSPGSVLVAEGEVQIGAFHTQGGVEIRRGQQTELLLEPVVAYEQGDRSKMVTGSYSFTLNSEGEWLVSVETPLSWWVDPQRRYPAVLDPTMKMLAPITTAAMCDLFSSSPCPATNYVDPVSNSKAIIIGTNSTWGLVDALVRFDQLPTLPPGYVIQSADLLLAAQNFVIAKSPQKNKIRVYQVTSAWNPGTVTSLSNRPTVAVPQLDQEDVLSNAKPDTPAAANHFVSRFRLQTGASGVVSDWLTNPFANHGLLLNYNYATLCYICNDAVTIDTTPQWSNEDFKWLDPANPVQNNASTTSGIMLQITYAPPTLTPNQPQFSELPTLEHATLGKIYADTKHAYLPAHSTSPWTAIAVKGLDQVISGPDLIDKAAGNLRLVRGCTNPFSLGCITQPSEGDFIGKPNFILTRGDPAATDLEAWVDPPSLASPANASLDSYLIDQVPSSNLAGNPTLTPGTSITLTQVMTTGEILHINNLNLVNNSRLGVRVMATAINPADNQEYEMPYLGAWAYKPAPVGSTLVKDFNGQNLGGHTAMGEFPMGYVKVGASQGGTWALALEYIGGVDPIIIDPDFNIITSTVPLDMNLKLNFVACQLDGLPTPHGCITFKFPGPSTPFMDVGNFRIFNEAGFNCIASSCSTKFQPGLGATAAMVFWKADYLAGQTNRAVGTAGAPIFFDTSTYSFFTAGVTALAANPPGGVEILELFTGDTLGYPDPTMSTSDPNYGRIVPADTASFLGLPLSDSDKAQMTMAVNVDRQMAEHATAIHRQVLTSPAVLEDFWFVLSWEVPAEGYAFMSNKNLVPVTVPNDAEVGSLTLLFGSAWDMDYRDDFAPNGRFTNLRNFPGAYGDGGAGARIAAPATLGGNWSGITALLLGVGVDIPGSEGACTGDCLDLRAADDTPTYASRIWDLPDLNIGGAAQTVTFSQPGSLEVFSTDHPNIKEAVTLPFNFRTFDGEVSVDVKVCPESGSPEKVVVITGKSRIALPGLGSETNPASMINAEFTLCETALRKTLLSFKGPPDIPAGSTGVLVDFLSGEVVIGPSNTEVKIKLNYHDNSDVVDGEATVTINTDGLFDLQTEGKVLQKVNYDGHAWVAWSPLDVGVDVTATYSSWLTGQVHVHLWKGQGWQNKYAWLPNNNETHFAGSIVASILIKKGQAFSWEFIDIPPWNISFSITVAFGQFCNGSGCSKYEWGIKGKFSVIGFDVGFFYGFSSGFHFILGSDGHKLIDQYASPSPLSAAFASDEELSRFRLGTDPPAGDGLMADAGPFSAGRALNLERITVPNPLAPTVTQPLVVTSYTGTFAAALTWSQGAPALTLVRPDNLVITPNNANTYGIGLAPTAGSLTYYVPNPMVGTWQAIISNTAANNNYHFAWFANKAIPSGIQLNNPNGSVNLSDNTTPFNLDWTVPGIQPGLDLRVSLYYTVTNSTALTSTQELGGVIRENLALTDGSYSWDLSSLAFGDYEVYARVYSGQPGNEPIQPTVTVTGTNQLPGDFWMTAPGVIHLLDSQPPATPTNLVMVPIENGFEACWDHNSEKDLSGYILRYISPNVYENTVMHDLRLPAALSDPNNWMQCARIGRFNPGENISVQIAAYDASGNQSPFSNLNEDVVGLGSPTYAPYAGPASLNMNNPTQPTLSWTSVSLPPGGGYWLYYSIGRPIGTGMVDPPFDMGTTNPWTFNLLDRGFVWFFMVQAHDDWARLGPPTNMVHGLVSDYVDLDNDGLPDDWEGAYEVSDPSLDEDGDGLDNLTELQNLTHPQYADTDNDEYSDGDELVAGSDPLDPQWTPATHEVFTTGVLPLPELNVNTQSLKFTDHQYPASGSPIYVSIANLGGGNLAPVVSDNASWLITNLFPAQGIPASEAVTGELSLVASEGYSLEVSVDPAGLAPGLYRATITISGAPGSFSQNSPQFIEVDYWVLEGASPSQPKIYLPLVVKP